MGRRSSELKARREERAQNAVNRPAKGPAADRKHSARAEELEEEVRQMVDGDAVFWNAGDCPDEIRVSNLEDILAFESVASGTSLFEGLQNNGVDLPRPEKLSEKQCAERAGAILRALARLRILLIGFEDMSPREFYCTLWHQTLWEGCYVEKRNPGAFTLIDVSHSLSRQDWQEFLEDLKKPDRVQ